MAHEPPKFERLPAACTCGGKGLVPVRDYPAVGIMPELDVYRCEKCGHVEIVEADALDTPKAV